MTRHLAIGDIHGCCTALTNLIEFVAPRADDVLITLGDYVDRGPDSCAVIDWLIHADEHRKLVPLRGNHDLMMLDARGGRESLETWLDCGGDTTLNSYSPFDGDHGTLADVPD